MLEYCKVILEKVSFNQLLFEKELKKSIGFILPEEIDSLIHWVQNNYTEQYADIIDVIIKPFIK